MSQFDFYFVLCTCKKYVHHNGILLLRFWQKNFVNIIILSGIELDFFLWFDKFVVKFNEVLIFFWTFLLTIEFVPQRIVYYLNSYREPKQGFKYKVMCIIINNYQVIISMYRKTICMLRDAYEL